jgi:hypothetical protein
MHPVRNLQQPYKRTISANTFKALTRPRYGLILTKPNPKYNSPSLKEIINYWYKVWFGDKHICQPPHFFARLWCKIKRTPMLAGSMYRCPCGEIFTLRDDKYGDDFWYSETTQELDQKRWIDAGGQL